MLKHANHHLSLQQVITFCWWRVWNIVRITKMWQRNTKWANPVRKVALIIKYYEKDWKKKTTSTISTQNAGRKLSVDILEFWHPNNLTLSVWWGRRGRGWRGEEEAGGRGPWEQLQIHIKLCLHFLILERMDLGKLGLMVVIFTFLDLSLLSCPFVKMQTYFYFSLNPSSLVFLFVQHRSQHFLHPNVSKLS